MDVIDATHELRESVPDTESTLYSAATNAGLGGNGSGWINIHGDCSEAVCLCHTVSHVNLLFNVLRPELLARE